MEEIEKKVNTTIDLTLGGNTTKFSDEYRDDMLRICKKEILRLIQSLRKSDMEEIERFIGEDEDKKWAVTPARKAYQNNRNSFRSELRSKLKEFRRKNDI